MKFSKFLIFVFFFDVFIIGCGKTTIQQMPDKESVFANPKSNTKSTANPKFSKEAQEVFNELNKSKNDILNAGINISDLNKFFYVSGNSNTSNINDVDVIFIGERHLSQTGQIRTASFVNNYIKSNSAINKNTILLFEGGKSLHNRECELRFLFNPFSTKQYKSIIKINNEPYNPADLYKLEDKYLDIIDNENIMSYLKIKPLMFDDNKCFYWDDPGADFAKRNESLSKTLSHFLNLQNKVILIAGMRHIPGYPPFIVTRRLAGQQIDAWPYLKNITQEEIFRLAREAILIRSSESEVDELKQRLHCFAEIKKHNKYTDVTHKKVYSEFLEEICRNSNELLSTEIIYQKIKTLKYLIAMPKKK
jgi:hypothetical protein